ncbi:MAG: hypothetical protein IKP15_03355 [Bacteroidales bacterium]|nr:hypothetical protein [Bacteroidales bacterium]
MTKLFSHIKVYVHHMDPELGEFDSGSLHCEEFYDQKGRLIRKWHSDIWTTYTYDSEGRLCEEREKRSLGTRTTIREYTPEGDLYHLKSTWEQCELFNGEHYCICPDDTVEGSEYYDDGESEEMWFSWKALGRLCEHERITKHWDGSEERSYLEEDYDDKGNIVEERIYGEKREMLLKTNYAYSEEGVLLEKATVAYYEDNSVGEPYCKSVYDDKERVVMHQGAGGHIMIFKFSDDEYGNWVLRNADIKDDSETEHLVFRRIIEYQNG